jgi:hypothetical protein
VKKEVATWLRAQAADFCDIGIQKLVPRLKESLDKGGDYLMYVCPCIIYENDERYQLDATILFIIINTVGYKLTHSVQDYTPAPQDLSHNT